MKTISDFKKRMQVGAKVSTKLYWYNKDTKEPILQRDYGVRTVSVNQSNSFAMKTRKIIDGDEVDVFTDSWANWPKKDEFIVIDKNTVKYTFGFGEIIYSFV